MKPHAPTMKTAFEFVCGGRLRLHRVLAPDAQDLLAVVRGLIDSDKFPGPLPVSLERSHFPTLKGAQYWLCEKTDGTRFALVCVRFRSLDVCCLMDRNAHLYLVPLQRVPTAMFQGSVIDGELAFDKLRKAWTFLAFDAVDLCGIPVHTFALSQRLAFLRTAMRPYEPAAADPLLIDIKQFVPSCMARSYTETGRFDADGIILTPETDPVTFGRHDALFKLKTHHTVDFEVSGNGKQLVVFDAQTRSKVAVADLETPDVPGAIVECELVPGASRLWRKVLTRVDKPRSNDMLTFTKTCLNIREGISVAELLDVFVPTGAPASVVV